MFGHAGLAIKRDETDYEALSGDIRVSLLVINDGFNLREFLSSCEASNRGFIALVAENEETGLVGREDVFNSFKGENMKFKNALSEDIKGLMALHEASHLCIEDEDILDEASIFTTNLLSARLSNFDDSDGL
nr:(3S,6E)-nerolidol synthase 1-like [Ipomoea batatas]